MAGSMCGIVIALALQLQGCGQTSVHLGSKPTVEVDKATVEKVIGMLEDNDPLANWGARKYLRELGADAKAIVPALVAALARGRAEGRANIAFGLSDIGPAAKNAVPALLECMKDRSPLVRYAAASALGSIGPEAKAAVPLLVEMLNTEDASARLKAADALCHIAKDLSAIPVLAKALEDKSVYHRVQAALILRDYGPLAQEAIPKLRTGLSDKESLVRVHCAWALWRVAKDRTVVSTLEKDFEDPKNIFRFDAARVLWEIEKRPAVLPTLRESLHEKDYTVRLYALLCVRDIGPQARELGADVKLLLKDPEDSIRKAAKEAIKAVESGN